MEGNTENGHAQVKTHDKVLVVQVKNNPCLPLHPLAIG